MKIGPPMVAFVTGAGSGIGRALALALAKRGVELSIVDLLEATGLETVKLVEEEYLKSARCSRLKALFIKCDVSKPGDIIAAFDKHKSFFGKLDICINNAGVSDGEYFTKDVSRDGTGAWRKVVDINLNAVIDCMRLGVQMMSECGNGGVILNVGSAAGLYPMFDGPIYSATKGGVVLFTRALGNLAKKKIRANVICPEAGKMKTGETILVTAAAGGTGQFAVQLAKLAGNKVIATCGGAEKASLLKDLDVDRVIDYKRETVSQVLKEEFPKGVDLVYESVGGEMFQTCLNALGMFGRLVIIGMVSQYTAGESWERSVHPAICEKLLMKSQSLVGFFLNHHVSKWRASVQRLYSLYSEGKLKVAVDPTPFYGVEAVADAVEYLYSGRSMGKVVVQIQSQNSSSRQSRL